VLPLLLASSLGAHAATKAAPAAQPAPELLNAPAAPAAPAEAKKDEGTATKGLAAPEAASPAAATPPASATIIAPPASTAAPATSSAPGTSLPPAAPATTSDASTTAQFERFLSLTITDILIALFTLVVALFAWRLSGAIARLASTAQSQSEITRRSVEASERAAEAAKRSADAAERSSTVMLDQSARQLRPYVTVKEFLQGPVKDDKQFLHGWVFQVVWQNTGATPTRGFRYWAALRQFEHEIAADFDFAAPMLADFAGGELGSHSTVTSGTLFVSQQDVLQIQAGTRKAVLYGKAEYHDVLGQDVKRETRFCVEVVLVSDPGGAHATPFSFSYFARHNAVS
jgi:hypothetical protein